MRSTVPANFPISLEEYETLPERTRDVDVVSATVVVVVEVVDVVGAIVVVVVEVVVVAVVLPQLVVRINTMMSEAMRRILYSFGLTRMRPS
jgi:hypothetical protein